VIFKIYLISRISPAQHLVSLRYLIFGEEAYQFLRARPPGFPLPQANRWAIRKCRRRARRNEA